MPPEYPQFKALEFEDLKGITPYLHKHAPDICEFSAANLLIWRDFDHPQTTLINKNLCIYISPPNEPPYFLEPLGNHKLAETLAVCLGYCGKISRATENFIKKLPTDRFKITCLRSQFDYIYETKVLAELKGRKFDGKRNHLKNFKRRHPDYEYRSLDPSLKNECLEIFEEWFRLRKESRYFPKLAYTSQKAALGNTFDYYEKLNLKGGAIFIDRKIKGFILGSPLNPETFSVHFQYGHPSLRGIFQALLWEACDKTFSSFKYVNLEQDLGIPGLRKAKLSYYPLRLEKKFELTPIQS